MSTRLAYPPWSPARLLARSDVSAAFAALADPHGALPWHTASPRDLTGCAARLAPFASRRLRADHDRRTPCERDHVEIPLHLVLAPPLSRAVTRLPSSSVRDCLPSAVRHVLDGLFDANIHFVQHQLGHPSIPLEARRDILHDVTRKGVLRLLRYSPGTGCRPHLDPGLATALLVGSAQGLEVLGEEATRALCGRDGAVTMGDYRDCAELLPTSPPTRGRDAPPEVPLHWLPADSLFAASRSQSTSSAIGESSAPALVMRGRMLQVLSHHALHGVLHRVNPAWSPCDSHAEAHGCPAEASARYNIVVELRPANAKRWYALSAAPPTPAATSTVADV